MDRLPDIMASLNAEGVYTIRPLDRADAAELKMKFGIDGE